MHRVFTIMAAAVLAAPSPAVADDEAPADAAPAAAKAPEGATATEAEDDSAAKLTWGGTVEAVWGYSLNAPSNEVINGRYYDVRHNVLGLQGAMLTNAWEAGDASGSLQLQFGALAELFWGPDRSVEQDLLWRLLQEATTKWTTPLQALSIEGGVYNTPFGPEYNLAYQNWNWSTSNLFALMPYQLAGMRANYAVGKGWGVRLGVYNGWDKIVTDNNGSKSVMASLEFDDPDDEENYFYVNYMVGNERGRTDPRGAHARHTLDVYGQWHATDRLFLRGHVLTGVENSDNDQYDGWFGAAAYLKYLVKDWLSVAVRGDGVRGFAGSQGDNWLYSSYLSDPTHSTTVMSGTATLAIQTGKNATVRLEARHDRADFDYYFGGVVPRDAGGAAVATEKNQTTVSLGLATWF
ncbi:MAG: outer membrane beta-barrel protein [Deltaproteobacteria bacterium]|nr:outer membrane beta-barrel protein [Deltaproteobacteria bacterium]